jgi:hypothetical protein
MRVRARIKSVDMVDPAHMCCDLARTELELEAGSLVWVESTAVNPNVPPCPACNTRHVGESGILVVGLIETKGAWLDVPIFVNIKILDIEEGVS